MKKLVISALFLLAITSCDDGNIKVQSINFEDVTAQKCGVNNLIYKLKDSEALILEIPSTAFENDATLENSPRTVTIDATNKLVYRSFNGTVTSGNVCGTILLSTPNVVEEWVTTSGTVQITTTANVVANTAINSANATKIANYNHSIVLKNTVFTKPNGNQLYETFNFGNYTTAATNLPFGFDEEVTKSSCDNRIFNFNGSEALIFDTSNFSVLFENTLTTTPRTALINSENKLTYTLYTAAINDANFCGTTALPTVNQTWTAVSGNIEVTTTSSGSSFQHTIHFKNVILKRGNSTFSLGDDYVYGSFLTSI
jgi:hypothetical protein